MASIIIFWRFHLTFVFSRQDFTEGKAKYFVTAGQLNALPLTQSANGLECYYQISTSSWEIHQEEKKK